MWNIRIIKADNGYILEMPREDEKGKIVIDKEVIEEDFATGDADNYETNDVDKIAMAKLLERIAEYFGVVYKKYENNNLNIKFNLPGSKL